MAKPSNSLHRAAVYSPAARAGSFYSAGARARSTAWTALLSFCGYRLLVALLFTAMSFFDPVPAPLGSVDAELFRGACIGYALAAACLVFVARAPGGSLSAQAVIGACIDAAALCTMMFASGGVRTGFGLLLAVSVAGAAALTPRRLALAFPALATIALLAEQYVLQRAAPGAATQPVYTAVVCIALFASAVIAQAAARRIDRAEALLREGEMRIASLGELNERVIGRMQAGVVVVDENGIVQLANVSVATLLGADAPRPGDALAATTPALAELLARWRRERGWSSAAMPDAAPGTRVQASFAELGEGCIVFLEDAARLHAQAQSLKLASLGRMAASIAHEIRNPLSAVSHARQLLDESEDLRSSDRRLLRIIGDNVRRMDGIVEDVLELGRGRPAEPSRIALASWLEDFAAEFRDAHRDGTLEVAVDPSTLEVRFDARQLRQVVDNLVRNAWAASERASVRLVGGIDAASGRPHLDVTDEGPGIATEDHDSVFEPFFTTRREGTGLGLHVARELCTANGASIDLTSGDSGACFRITFSDPRRLGAAPEPRP